MLKLSRLIALLSLIFVMQSVHAQNAFTIHITEPADGSIITGPFRLRGDSTIPAEKQVTLRITATDSGKVLANQGLPLTGDVGTQGNFNFVINFNVSGDTPVLIEVLYTAQGSTVSAQVHVTLRKADSPAAPPLPPAQSDQPELDASLEAAKLALTDYEARVQVVTPFPVSVQDQSFSDSCLGLARTNEKCAAGAVDGKVVKVFYGGAPYIYHVGGDQARLDIDASTLIKQKTQTIPKLINDAMAATGVKLYVPQRLVGPFQGLPLSQIAWDNGIVTLKYAVTGNSVDIAVMEQVLTPNAAIPAAGTGENLTLGSATVPIQSVNGRRVIVWSIAGTLVNVSVPGSVSTAALNDLATGFALIGSTEPGQINPYDLSQFDRLTLALPEPMRSVEMARQALMSVLRPPRQGKVISIVTTNFKDTCLGLIRQEESTCTQATTPGYVIGVADTELYRYHVAGQTVRLNREDSALLDKVSVEYATIEAAQGFVQFQIVAPNAADLILTGVQIGSTSQIASILLTYRDSKTGGAFALRESSSDVAPGTLMNNGGNGISQTFFVKIGTSQTQVTLWVSPELTTDGITRIQNAIAGKS